EVAPATAKNAAEKGVAAAAVPGSVAGLAALHARFGSKKWEGLLEPAIALARAGVRIDVELASAIRAAKQERKIEPFAGQRVDAGATLVQTDLASTLERIAVSGARQFYDGETARRIVDDGRAAGGAVSLRDLRDSNPLWPAPMRPVFRA